LGRPAALLSAESARKKTENFQAVRVLLTL
jgi:hypothetical protein